METALAVGRCSGVTGLDCRVYLLRALVIHFPEWKEGLLQAWLEDYPDDKQPRWLKEEG